MSEYLKLYADWLDMQQAFVTWLEDWIKIWNRAGIK